MMSQTLRLFDVFETLLVRQIGEPSSVFLLLGNRLASAGLTTLTPERFAREREHAYQRARRRAMPRDACLDDVYRELADVHDWSEAEREVILAQELELESRLLRPWPPGVEALERARSAGARICFVSDTQFPLDFLWRELRAHNLAHDGDEIFASSERSGTKLGGELFAEVLNTFQAEPATVVHTGNNLSADVVSARRAGIGTNLLTSGNLNRYELAMEGYRFATSGLASAFAGASRLARGDGPLDDPLVRIAAGVGAPAITGYVLWLLRRAERHGIQRLFFLSREGQFLQWLANELAASLKIEIEFAYLHGSRVSLNLAALRSTDRRNLAWVLTHGHTDTFRNLLRRVGLNPERCQGELHAAGLPAAIWDDTPTVAQHRRLVDALEGPQLGPMVLAAAATEREMALAYLKEVGFLDSVQVGIVDSAGIGSQFRSLASLRSGVGLSAPRGYLFVRTRSLSPDGDLSDTGLASFEGYFEDSVRGLGTGKLPGLTVLLEHFLAADHGMVLGYERSHDASVVPVMAKAPSPNQMVGVHTFRSTVGQFLEHLVLDEDLLDVSADVRSMSRDLLAELWLSPARDEAQALLRLRFEDGTGTIASLRISRPVPLVKLAPYIFRTRRGLQPSYHWKSGSLALSSRSVRFTYLALRRIRRGIRRLRRHLAGLPR